jgi:hypothetical protein
MTTLIIPVPITQDSSINIDDMYLVFEEVNNKIYTRCKTKYIFLKKIGLNMFSLEIKYSGSPNNYIIYFSLQDNKIYFQPYMSDKSDILLYYIFLKITSVLINYKTYVYVYNVYNGSQSYNIFFELLNIVKMKNSSVIYSILHEENKPYLEYLIKKNIIKQTESSDSDIHITTKGNNSITLNSTNKYVLDNTEDLGFLKMYNKTITNSYLIENKSVNVFFNIEGMNLDELLDELIRDMRCKSKRKKIRLSNTKKHKPLSFEKKSRSFKSATNSITRKIKSNNFASTTRKLYKDLPVFNKVDIPDDIPVFNDDKNNIGLLIVNAHGSIQIRKTESNMLQLPLVDIPVGTTKLYYKSITLPGYVNYFEKENQDINPSFNSEENDYEYIGDSQLSDIETVSEYTTIYNNFHKITLAHYRNIFERCFKKNPLKFYEKFYSCGNKIINKYLRGIKSNLRPHDKKEIDYSKLNKTTGSGPIHTILDKKLTLGSDKKENTKITFIVFNNSSKKFEKYNLSDFSHKNIVMLAKTFKSMSNIAQIKSGTIYLSSLINLVLSYREGLSSLYVYDTSCSTYNSEVEPHRLDEIDEMIDALPDTIGK